jgi:RNA polymerase sigma-70 factor (ECF subfamily)
VYTDKRTTAEEKCLFERVREGDAGAFEIIVRSYVKELGSFAKYFVKSHDVAEDIVQNLFIHLWEKKNSIRIKGRLRTYLFAAIRNRSLDYLKHQSIDQKYSYGYSQLVPLPSTPHEIVELRELDDLIMKALEKLPERRRIVFILNKYCNMTYAEIAEILEITVKTVDAHMVNAVKSLRSDLQSL